MKHLIEKLFPVHELKQTITRFPLAILSTVALFILAILQVHKILDLSEAISISLFYGLACFSLVFIILRLLKESDAFSQKIYYAISLLITGFILYLSIFLCNQDNIPLVLSTYLCLVLILMVSPYLKNRDDLSFWVFKWQLLQGCGLSFWVSILFYLGICGTLLALDMLLGINIGDKLYLDFWLFASLVLAPIYFLSIVPKQFVTENNDCDQYTGLKFIANWILVPFYLIYLTILYLYYVKILVTQTLPHGYLAIISTGFMGTGVVAHLISWPLKDTGIWLTQLFHKIFFWTLFIPIGFYIYAICLRVDAYGITQPRYYLIVFAIWLSFLALAYSFRKIALKYILISLAGLLFFASFGPWGAEQVSVNSQYHRLSVLLEKNELLPISKDQYINDIPSEDRREISSALKYLCKNKQQKLLSEIFPIDPKKQCFAYIITKEHLGFEFSSYYANQNREKFYYFTPKIETHFFIDDYSLLLQDIHLYLSKNDNVNINADKKYSFVLTENNEISISIDDQQKLVIPLTEMILKRHHQEQADKFDEPLYIKSDDGSLKYLIQFRNINGKLDKSLKDVKISSLTFDIFIE